MIIQLNPAIPMMTPKGEGLAWLMIDYGMEFNLLWVVAINETGEIWTLQNPLVRALKNITQGRLTMPLIKGKAAKTKKGFSENVKREMNAGKPQKQAVAIAYSESGEKKSTKRRKK